VVSILAQHSLDEGVGRLFFNSQERLDRLWGAIGYYIFDLRPGDPVEYEAGVNNNYPCAWKARRLGANVEPRGERLSAHDSHNPLHPDALPGRGSCPNIFNPASRQHVLATTPSPWASGRSWRVLGEKYPVIANGPDPPFHPRAVSSKVPAHSGVHSGSSRIARTIPNGRLQFHSGLFRDPSTLCHLSLFCLGSPAEHPAAKPPLVEPPEDDNL
jgi:hypothetical protein